MTSENAHAIVQGSPEWYAIRLGKVTASRIADMVARTKTGWGASRQNYAAQLIAERMTGVPGESYTNAIMERGSELEPMARALYEFTYDAPVIEIGFAPHPIITMSGASPDGLVGDDGLVQFKCPLTATHIETLRGGSIPGKYICQVQWEMACTGRKWCDWCSFDPRMPVDLQLYRQRIPRDDAKILELHKQVLEFLATEVDEAIADLTRKYRRAAA